jgi:hypothetical protein
MGGSVVPIKQAVSTNFSGNLTTYMGGDGQKRVRDKILNLPDELENIHTKAHKEGLTLEDYVNQYTEEANRYAQFYLSQWESIQANAVLTGFIDVGGGEVILSREVSKLLGNIIDGARKDLLEVQRLTVKYGGVGSRQSRLMELLWEKASSGRSGDMQAIREILDRVEGKTSIKRLQEDNMTTKYNVWRIINSMFEKQLQIINSGNGTKMIMAGRRAGKSQMLVALCLIECMMKPNTRCIYIGLTMETALELVEGVANEIVDICELKNADGSRLDWKHLENGSKILVRGLSDVKQSNRFRGWKSPLIIIDEFFHHDGDLVRYLFNEVLRPMQLDYKGNYKFFFAGSPPPVRGTWQEQQWESMPCWKLEWTALENPHMADGFDEFVAESARLAGLSVDAPKIQREYYNKRIYDDDLLLYPDYHTFDADEVMPRFEVDKVLIGIDYGENGISGNNAIIATAWSSSERRGFVFYEAKYNVLTCKKGCSMLDYLKDLVLEVWDMSLSWWGGSITKAEANNRIWWEADSYGNQISDEIRHNVSLYGLAPRIATAEKIDKVLMQDKIKSLLRNADLLLPLHSLVEKECMQTILKRDARGNIMQEIDSKTYHPDLLDALRYSLYPVLGNESIDRGDRMIKRETY